MPTLAYFDVHCIAQLNCNSQIDSVLINFSSVQKYAISPKVPSERLWSLDASIFIQTQQTVPNMKAKI